MADSNRAAVVQHPFRGDVSGMGFLCGSEDSKGHSLSVHADPGHPFVSMLLYAKQAAFAAGVGGLPVLAIHSRRYVAQIPDPIIGWVPIHMVNIPFRPLASDVKPDEAVNQVSHAEHTDIGIAVGHLAAGYLADLDSIARAHLPDEVASEDVVVKEQARFFCSDAVLFHAESLVSTNVPPSIH